MMKVRDLRLAGRKSPFQVGMIEGLISFTAMFSGEEGTRSEFFRTNHGWQALVAE